MCAADIDLKAVIFGQVPVAAQVPLAYVPRLIAAFVESAGQRVLARRKLLEIRHIDELTPRWVDVRPVHIDPVGDADGGWVLAGEDAGAGREEQTGQAAYASVKRMPSRGEGGRCWASRRRSCRSRRGPSSPYRR